MLRRFAALVGIVAILALASLLVWQIWLHAQRTARGEALVSVQQTAGPARA